MASIREMLGDSAKEIHQTYRRKLGIPDTPPPPKKQVAKPTTARAKSKRKGKPKKSRRIGKLPPLALQAVPAKIRLSDKSKSARKALGFKVTWDKRKDAERVSRLDTRSLLTAIGSGHLPLSFAASDRVSAKFADIKRCYSFSGSGREITLEICRELSEMPHLFFTVAARAFVDLEWHLFRRSNGPIDTKISSYKVLCLGRIARGDGYTFDRSTNNVWIRSNSPAEHRAKLFLKESRAFEVYDAALGHLTLKQIDKMKAESNYILRDIRVSIEKGEYPRIPGRILVSASSSVIKKKQKKKNRHTFYSSSEYSRGNGLVVSIPMGGQPGYRLKR